MADASPNLAIRTLNGDPTAWLPVVAPITCGAVVIQNTDGAGQVKVRTDANDPTTQKTAPPSMELTFRVSVITGGFGPGQIICFVQPTQANLPLVVTFLR